MVSPVMVRFGADVSGVGSAMLQASRSVSEFTTNAKNSVENANSAFKEAGSIISDVGKLAAGIVAANFALKTFAVTDIGVAAAATLSGTAMGRAALSAGSLASGLLSSASNAVVATVAADAFGYAIMAAPAVGAIAMGYLTVKALEAAKAIEAVGKEMAFSGNIANMDTVVNGFDLTTKYVQDYLSALQKIPGVTQDDAVSIQSLFGSIHNYSTVVNDGLVEIVTKLASSKEQARSVATQLAAVFNDPNTKGRDFLNTLEGVTAAERQQFSAAQATGNVNRMNAALYDVLIGRIKALGQEEMRAGRERLQNALTLQGSSGAYQKIIEAQSKILDVQNAKLQDNITLLNQRADAIRNQPVTAEQTAFQSSKIVTEDQTSTDQIDEHAKRLAILNQQLENNKTYSALSESASKSLAEAIAQEKQAITDLTDKQAGGNATQLAQLAIDRADVSGKQDLARNLRALAQAANDEAAGATTPDRRTAAVQRYYQLTRQARDAEDAAAKASAQVQAADYEDGDRRKAAILNQALSREQAAYARGSAQYNQIELQKVQNNEAVRRADNADAAASAETKYQNALHGIEAEATAIKQQAQDHQISYQEELTELLANNTQKEAAERTYWAEIEKIWGDGTSQYREAKNKLLQIDQANAPLRAQIEKDVNKQIVQDYKSSFEQIGSGVTSSIMGIIQGQSKLVDAVRSIALQIVQSFISARIKWAADWAAGQASDLAGTTATEAAKTGVVTAGAAARATAESAGSTVSMAANLGAIMKSISASAGETFAGIFGFLAPVMGPAAAAPAGAGMATVLGVAGGIASHASGSWELPHDMISQVHKGEMIIPAGPAAAMRDALSGGGGGAPGGGHTFNINYSAERGTTLDTLKVHSREIAKLVSAELNQQPSLRPRY